MDCTLRNRRINNDSSKIAKIDSLAVDPNHHRSKARYGSQLAQAAVKFCWENEYNTILTTAMPSSRGLFERIGFEVYETHDSGNVSMFLDRE